MFLIADIATLPFHFARWRFAGCQNVKSVVIDPADDAPLTDSVDAIFAITVLEHLPRPMAIVRHWYERLRPGGVLVFDYIKSEGKGLDTLASSALRSEVLTWIREHFEVVSGAIEPPYMDIGRPICRKPV